jgi:hypothetical protein
MALRARSQSARSHGLARSSTMRCTGAAARLPAHPRLASAQHTRGIGASSLPLATPSPRHGVPLQHDRRLRQMQAACCRAAVLPDMNQTRTALLLLHWRQRGPS